MTPDSRVAVVGAGAAGLSVAWLLKKQGYRHVTVLEVADRIGGKCKSLTYDGRSRVIERVHQKAWPYFPHPGLTELAGGYFLRLQALQGHRQTFYAGALLDMETVGNTVANTRRLVTAQFPPLT